MVCGVWCDVVLPQKGTVPQVLDRIGIGLQGVKHGVMFPLSCCDSHMGHLGSGVGVGGVSGAAMCGQNCWHTFVTTFGS